MGRDGNQKLGGERRWRSFSCDSFSAWLDHQRENSGSFSLLCTYKKPLLGQCERRVIIWCCFLTEM